MAKKMYGQGTINKLRDSGYSNRAIEDITFISEMYRAKPSKVEKLLSKGYIPEQVKEIYSAARKYTQSVNVIEKFYNCFRPEKNKLSGMVSKVRSEWDGDLNVALSSMVGLSCIHGRNFDETLPHLCNALTGDSSLKGDYPDEEDRGSLGDFREEINRVAMEELNHIIGTD